MEHDEKFSDQAENQASEKELAQKELEKVSGGLKMAPTVSDSELEPFMGEFGGKAGIISGQFGGKGGLTGDVTGRNNGSGAFGGKGGITGEVGGKVI